MVGQHYSNYISFVERNDSRSFFSINYHQVVIEVMEEIFFKKLKRSSDESPFRFLPNLTHIKIEGNEQRTVLRAIHSAVFLIQRINAPINEKRRKIKACLSVTRGHYNCPEEGSTVR